MQWEGRRKSSNMEDRRGMRTTGKVATGAGIIGILFLLIQAFMGGDSAQLVQALQEQVVQGGGVETVTEELSEEDKRLGDFVGTVLADTEDVWHKLFKENGATYKEPKLILFRDAVRSACGGANSNSGPFYCPADETIYMDLSFFDVLVNRFGAKRGDFAIAYVIAHEVGHHVQKQTGVLDKINQARNSMPKSQFTPLHVAMELQADFYAGVWAHHIRKYLDEKDFELALAAAASVGNDNIQKRTQGYVVEESFTHGSSEQRMYWLSRGFNTGDIRQGDTFAEIK